MSETDAGTNLAIRDAAIKARDLIGNQSGDITGAALDAWVILSDALREDVKS